MNFDCAVERDVPAKPWTTSNTFFSSIAIFTGDTAFTAPLISEGDADIEGLLPW